MAVGCGNLESQGFQDGGCEAFSDFFEPKHGMSYCWWPAFAPGFLGVHQGKSISVKVWDLFWNPLACWEWKGARFNGAIWGLYLKITPLYYTVDGRNPAPVDVVNILFYFLLGLFIHPRWFFPDFWTINSLCLERLGNPAGSHRSSGTAQHSLVDATPGSSRCPRERWMLPAGRNGGNGGTNQQKGGRLEKGKGGLAKKTWIYNIYLCGCVYDVVFRVEVVFLFIPKSLSKY